eukprot:m.2721 g.2721  ORF g.2721 m.2721 type:complete len:234 (+) comp8859_c0_seq1:891-1592(+)
MHVEIEIAGDFVVSFLTDLSMEKIEELHYNLSKILTDRYEGHWYPGRPCRGNAYRCLNVSLGIVDPVLRQAIRRSGLKESQFRSYFPENLSVWVDPNEVSYRVGDRGPTETLFCQSSEDAGHLANHRTGYESTPVAQSSHNASYAWESPRPVYRDFPGSTQFDSYGSDSAGSSDSEYGDGDFVTYRGEVFNRQVLATYLQQQPPSGALSYEGSGHAPPSYSPYGSARKQTVVY